MPDQISPDCGQEDIIDSGVSGKHRDGSRVLPDYVVIMLGAAVTLAVLLLMRQFSGIIGPVFMALNLVIAAYPINRWLRSKGTPGWLAASVMVIAVIVILLCLVFGLIWAISAMVSELPKYSAQYINLYNSALDLLAHYGIKTSGISDLLQLINPSSVVAVLSSVLSSATAITVVVVVIVTTLVFMAMDVPTVRQRRRTITSNYPRLGWSLGHFTVNARRYWVVTTIFGALLAILDGIALAIMGIPLAPVWALLVFLANFIPSIGFLIGLTPPTLFALLGGGWQLALAVVIVFSVLTFIVTMLIQPRVVGETVGVTPTTGFVSLLLWGTVLGPLGALLAVPMTLLLKALFVDGEPKAAWVGAIISMERSKPRSKPRAKPSS